MVTILKFFSSVKRERRLHCLPMFFENYRMALEAGVLRLKTAKQCETTALRTDVIASTQLHLDSLWVSEIKG